MRTMTPRWNETPTTRQNVSRVRDDGSLLTFDDIIATARKPEACYSFSISVMRQTTDNSSSEGQKTRPHNCVVFASYALPWIMKWPRREALRRIVPIDLTNIYWKTSKKTKIWDKLRKKVRFICVFRKSLYIFAVWNSLFAVKTRSDGRRIRRYSATQKQPLTTGRAKRLDRDIEQIESLITSHYSLKTNYCYGKKITLSINAAAPAALRLRGKGTRDYGNVHCGSGLFVYKFHYEG